MKSSNFEENQRIFTRFYVNFFQLLPHFQTAKLQWKMIQMRFTAPQNFHNHFLLISVFRFEIQPRCKTDGICHIYFENGKSLCSEINFANQIFSWTFDQPSNFQRIKHVFFNLEFFFGKLIMSSKNMSNSFFFFSILLNFTWFQLLYIPLVIYVPALAFNQVTGINLHMIANIVCAVCIFYTTLVSLLMRLYSHIPI